MVVSECGRELDVDGLAAVTMEGLHVFVFTVASVLTHTLALAQVKMVMALAATLPGVYTTDINVNNVISQSIAGVNAPAAPVQAVANPTLNNPSVSAPSISTTGTAIPGVRQVPESLYDAATVVVESMVAMGAVAGDTYTKLPACPKDGGVAPRSWYSQRPGCNRFGDSLHEFRCVPASSE